MFLIGGSSHAGKSTLGEAVANHFGCRCISTDSLAKHPGRPWRDPPEQPPPHVAEHYRDLALDEMMQSVLTHYRSMWNPLVLPLIESGEHLVLEGSALLPELVWQLDMQHARAIWLVAAEGVLERRIRAESDYDSRDPDARFLIDKFAQRAVAFNRFVGEEASRLSLQRIEVSRETSVNELLLPLCLEEPR
ncbi:UNVERIFIED_ORG: 2-phosphoglycerate kinase [Agrobacterium larrymoorei]|nr:2-phosphoglycerate kinase [Agrobacterium larrymoorei]